MCHILHRFKILIHFGLAMLREEILMDYNIERRVGEMFGMLPEEGRMAILLLG